MRRRPIIPETQLPLLGRDAGLATLSASVGSGRRLTTVRGAVGVGKSALVRAWAHPRDGTEVIDLHECSGVASLSRAISNALEIALPAATDDAAALRSLASALLAQDLVVLVLDGAHGAQAVLRSMLERLLAAPSGPAVVTTSRRDFGVAAEAVIELGPLEVPEPGEALASASAGQLWLELMRRDDPTRELSAVERDDVAAILRAVDGLPLAIEMGVRRERLLGSRALRQRWEEGDTAIEPIERAFTISWEELSDVQRTVLGQLTVFRGGWPLPLGERVLSHLDVDLPEVVQALIERSHLQLSRSGAEPKVRMLRSVREHVSRRATPSPETSGSHALECAAGAEGADVEDLAAAFDWALEREALPLAVEALWRLDLRRWRGGAPDAHLERLRRIEERVEQLDPRQAWRIFEMLGRWRTRLGQDGEAALERAAELGRGVNDAEAVARSSRSLALLHSQHGRTERALDAAQAAVASAAEVDRSMLARCIRTEATVSRRAGLGERADAAYRRSLELYSELGDDPGRATTLAEWSLHQLETGDIAQAKLSADRARPLLVAHRLRYLHTYLDASWGLQAQVDGDLPLAAERLESAALRAARHGDDRLDRVCRGYLALVGVELGTATVESAVDTLDSVDAKYAVPYGAVLRALFAFLLADSGQPSHAAAQLNLARSRQLPESNFRLALEVMIAATEMAIAAGAGDAPAAQSRETASALLRRAAAGGLRSGDGSAQAVSDLRLATRWITRWLRRRVEPAPVLRLTPDARLASTARFGRVDLSGRPLLARILHRLAKAAETEERHITVEQLLEAGWPGELMVGGSGVRRLQVAVNRLRGLGLREIISTVPGGYGVAAPWTIAWVEAQELAADG